MLSYDPPVSVNSQGLPSTMPPSPKTTRLPAAAPTVAPGTTSNNAALTNGAVATPEHHIWLVTGPAGCGKTTVAQYLSQTLDLPYIEGDQYHPPANIEKMSNGIPLTDADRWDWLTVLRDEAMNCLHAGHEGVVVTCSALKRKYRDVIRVAGYYDPKVHLHFIYLSASEEVLLKRVGARENHYMGANMVHSQFEALEPPTAAEMDVLSVNVDMTPEEVMGEALNKVLLVLQQSASAATAPASTNP